MKAASASCLLLALVSVSTLPGWGQARSPEREKLSLQEGVALYDRGDFAGARTKYLEVLAANPKNETAHYELALTYSAEKNWQECIQTAEAGLKSAQRLRHGLYAMAGNCYDNAGQNDKAIRAYEKGLKDAPDDPQLLYNLAVGLKTAGKIEKAIQRAEDAVRAAPRYGSANLLLASLYAHRGDKVSALLSYLGFLEVEADTSRALGVARLVPGILSHGVTAEADGGTTMTLGAGFGKGSTPLEAAELAMLMAAATQGLPENTVKSDFDKLLENLVSVLTMFAEMNIEKERGCFACSHYLPTFIELRSQGFLEPFLYTAFAPLALGGTTDWATAHKEGLEKFHAARQAKAAH